MTTYEITPETEIKGYDLSSPIYDTSTATCRRFCNDDGNCEAFVWRGSKNGTCILKSKSDGATSWNSDSILYIKRGNSGYWLLWIFLAILGIIIFIKMCRRKR